ncbi:ABC transporter substrate-binding protein [Alicyclobacillus tengchongensis]|nr:ABC transporter substrate-binding protein [Alicyclobacillus tengchongensis]
MLHTQRIAEERVVFVPRSRKKAAGLLVSAGVIAAGVVILVTRGDGDGGVPMTAQAVPAASVSAGPSVNNGVVRISAPTGTSLTSLDPSQWGAQILVDQGTIMEGLYGYKQKNEIVPKIAAGYKLSNNGLTWTFTLRKDARWSNGQPVTAQDFYYAYMRQMSPSNPNGQLWLSVLNVVKNSYAYHAGTVPASAVGLKVINNYTLQITTSAPHYILGDLAEAGSMPINEQVAKAHPTNWFLPQYFVSDAPYTVKSFQANGPLILVRNPKYVGHPGEVNFGSAKEIDVLPGTSVSVEDFMANKIDVTTIGSTSDLQYVKNHGQLQSEMHKAPDYGVTYLQYDNSAVPSPLDKPAVRQAIAMAIDRQPIVNDVLGGMGGITNTFSVPGWPTAKYEKGIATNIAEAKQLLAKAGYPNGKGLPTIYLYAEVPSSSPQSVPVAEAVQEELQQNLGIQTKIVQLNATDWGNLTYGGPQQNIQPGYNVAVGGTNDLDPASLNLGGDQGVYWPGTYGYSNQFVQHVLPWYNTPYDPASIKKYGDPNNPNEGVKWSQWSALVKAAKADIAYLNKWTSQQPAQWRAIMDPPGSLSLTQQWNQIVNSWNQAKSATAKHAAYVQAWKFVAPYTEGSGGGGINTSSLDVQVYWDQHESADVKNWRMWQAEYQNSPSMFASASTAAKLMTQLIQQGYTIPLFYGETYYLERTGVTGAQPNPWSWGGFYQMQYLSAK